MQISYLEDYPEFIPVLAPAMITQWRDVLPEDTLESRTKQLQKHLNKNKLPIAWVAHDQTEVFGTAALRVHDLEDRKDLTPWLGGVFVRPEYRRRGIASALCLAVEQKTWSLGYDSLYLFTPDKQSFYLRLGWQYCQKATWRGSPIDIMIKHNKNALENR